MWNAIKSMAASKKFMMAVVSALVWILGKFGLEWDASDLLPIVAPLWAYIFGQGMADMGKERAKIEAAVANKVLDKGADSPLPLAPEES